MKKLLLGITILIFISSCKVSQPPNATNSINTDNLKDLSREDYIIKETVSEDMNFQIVWFLFLKFGASRDENFRREQLYLKTCKKYGYDGILQPKFLTKRILVPLILITDVNYKTTLTGKGYTIKTN
jgi:hypothetical protein